MERFARIIDALRRFFTRQRERFSQWVRRQPPFRAFPPKADQPGPQPTTPKPCVKAKGTAATMTCKQAKCPEGYTVHTESNINTVFSVICCPEGYDPVVVSPPGQPEYAICRKK